MFIRKNSRGNVIFVWPVLKIRIISGQVFDDSYFISDGSTERYRDKDTISHPSKIKSDVDNVEQKSKPFVLFILPLGQRLRTFFTFIGSDHYARDFLQVTIYKRLCAMSIRSRIHILIPQWLIFKPRPGPEGQFLKCGSKP